MTATPNTGTTFAQAKAQPGSDYMITYDNNGNAVLWDRNTKRPLLGQASASFGPYHAPQRVDYDEATGVATVVPVVDYEVGYIPQPGAEQLTTNGDLLSGLNMIAAGAALVAKASGFQPKS